MNKFLLSILLVCGLALPAVAQQIAVTTLISAATVVNTKTTTLSNISKKTFQAVGTTSSGAGAATIVCRGSNDGSNWISLATITLTLSTTASSDGFAMDAPWRNIQCEVTAISGTGASVSVYVGG
jgi:hypothetical protein